MNTDGSDPVKISTCAAMGIDDGMAFQVNLISPNPANDILIVNLDKDFSLVVYDLTGKSVLSSSEKQINISGFSKGIYTVVLKDKNAQLIKTEKLIKN